MDRRVCTCLTVLLLVVAGGTPHEARAAAEDVQLAQADSVDGLFELDETEAPGDESEEPGEAADAVESPAEVAAPVDQSPEDLFGIPDESGQQTTTAAPDSTPSDDKPRLVTGFWQNELGYAYAGSGYFSKWKNHLRLISKGQLSANVKWQIGGHLIFDPIFLLNDQYSDRVEDDQKLDGWLHETFLDISLGSWEIRLGRQNIVWGEAVGLFFADVISALDLREFVLPDFDIMRIPQWAVRAEYYSDDFHGELVYIPRMTPDEIGEPGAEFYPLTLDAPPGFDVRVLDENEPSELGEDYGLGTRLSYDLKGWDMAAFYFTSPDKSPAFERRIGLGPAPVIQLQPIHERIHQLGGTLAKGFGSTVIKSELVYTKDRLATVSDITDVDGLERIDELRILLGLDWSVGDHYTNLQLFQTRFLDHLPSMLPDEEESGLSMLYRTTALHPDLEGEALWIRSLNRNEWLLQAKLTWHIDAHWRGVVGTDIFDGPRQAFLGQYRDQDRVYCEMRYSF